MVVGVDAGLAVVEVRWWYPFGVAAVVFAGGPALFGDFVIGAAGQRQVVDIGGVGFRPGRDVVHFRQVAGHCATRRRAATILGVQVTIVHPSRKPGLNGVFAGYAASLSAEVSSRSRPVGAT
jgi:hypothetical protein